MSIMYVKTLYYSVSGRVHLTVSTWHAYLIIMNKVYFTQVSLSLLPIKNIFLSIYNYLKLQFSERRTVVQQDNELMFINFPRVLSIHWSCERFPDLMNSSWLLNALCTVFGTYEVNIINYATTWSTMIKWLKYPVYAQLDIHGFVSWYGK